MEAMIIREMTIDDVPAVMQIEQEAFTSPWSGMMFIEDIIASDERCWAAENEGVLQGYLCLRIIVDELHITNIAVRRDVRRLGVADDLMKKAFMLADKQKCAIITLEVRDGNEAAINLYGKYGFNCRGRRKNYYLSDGADALIMTKNIGGNYELV